MLTLSVLIAHALERWMRRPNPDTDAPPEEEEENGFGCGASPRIRSPRKLPSLALDGALPASSSPEPPPEPNRQTEQVVEYWTEETAFPVTQVLWGHLPIQYSWSSVLNRRIVTPGVRLMGSNPRMISSKLPTNQQMFPWMYCCYRIKYPGRCGVTEKKTHGIILTSDPSCDQTLDENVLGAPGAPESRDGDFAEGNELGCSEGDESLRVDQKEPDEQSKFEAEATWEACGDGSGDFFLSLEDPPDSEDRGRGAKADGEQSKCDVPLTPTSPAHVFVDETPMEEFKKDEDYQTNGVEEDNEGLLMVEMSEAALPNLEGCGDSKEMTAEIILAGTPSSDQAPGEEFLAATGDPEACDGDVSEGNDLGRSEGDVSLQVDQKEPDEQSQFVGEATWEACGDASGDFLLSLEDSSGSEDRGLGAEADGEQFQGDLPLTPTLLTNFFLEEPPLEELERAEDNQTKGGEEDHRSFLLAEMPKSAAANLEGCGKSEDHGLGADADGEQSLCDVPLTATPPTHVFVDETPMEELERAEDIQTNGVEEDNEGLLMAEMSEAALPNLEGCGDSEMTSEIILAGTPSCDQAPDGDVLGAPGAPEACEGDGVEGNELVCSEGDESLQVDQNGSDGQFVADATWDACRDDFLLSLEDLPDSEDCARGAKDDGEQSQCDVPLTATPPTHVFVDETPMGEFNKAEDNQTNDEEEDHQGLLAEIPMVAPPNLEGCGDSEMTADIILAGTPSYDQAPDGKFLDAPRAPEACDGDVAEGNELGRSEGDVSLWVHENESDEQSQFISDATWEACGDASGDSLLSLEDSSGSEDHGLGAEADGEQFQGDLALIPTPPTNVLLNELTPEEFPGAQGDLTNSGEEDHQGLLLAEIPMVAPPNLEGCGDSEMTADIILAGTPSCDQAPDGDLLGAPGAPEPCDGDVFLPISPNGAEGFKLPRRREQDLQKSPHQTLVTQAAEVGPSPRKGPLRRRWKHLKKNRCCVS